MFASIQIALVMEAGRVQHVIWKNVQIIVGIMRKEGYVSLNLVVNVAKTIKGMIVDNWQ